MSILQNTLHAFIIKSHLRNNIILVPDKHISGQILFYIVNDKM